MFRYLIIMDYCSSRLYKTTLEKGEKPEEVIQNLGYNLDEVSWMTCKNNISLQILER